MKNIYKITLTVLLSIVFLTDVKAQSGNCDPSVPNFFVDLSGNSDSVWVSTPVIRTGNCCGTSHPDECVRFLITLDSNVAGINFNIVSGAVPGGSMFYQIDCGPIVAVGSPICLSGPGPYELTFCKPGNNNNTYGIVSVPAPLVETVADNGNCSNSISAAGLITSTVVMTSIYPGVPGQYDSYLSCPSGCNTSIVSPANNAPSYVDYLVCGDVILPACYGGVSFCDTVRVAFVNNLIVSATPDSIVFCANEGPKVLHGSFSGGSGPYTYFWTNGINGSGAVVGNDTVLSVTTSGIYSFVVRDSRYPTCSQKFDNVNVRFNPMPVLSMVAIPVKCFGQATGSVNITVSGGTSPYTYIWSNGAVSEDLTNIVAGTYSVTTTDANGCTATVSAVISQPVSSIVNSVTGSVNVLCFGQATGSVNITVSGGTSPYTYLWSNGAVSEDLTNIVAGTYSVTATDANGCTATASRIVTQPVAPFSASVTGSVNVLCFGQATGSVNITVSGGTSPYSYLWSNGAITEDLTNILAGTYTVTATDANGCTATSSRIVTQPVAPLSASVTGSVNVLCFGQATGSVNITVSGGTSPYTYLWSNGAVSEDLTNIVAGTYSVTATDANGCTATASRIVTQPVAPLSASVTGSVNVLCFGQATGSVNITVSGGTSPYTYLWSNGAVSEDLTNIVAGTYSVTATDANGCTATVSRIVTQPVAPLSASVTGSVNVLCFGQATGSVNISVSGGTSPYSYLWSNGSITEDLTNVLAGTYTVTATDANGCTATASRIVTQPVAPLSASVTGSVNVLCFGQATGSVNITVSGGTSPYTYLWSNGAITEDLTNVLAGTYTVTATDANGCTATVSRIVTQPIAPLSASVTGSVNVLCFGQATGSVNITVSGGTSPYSYLWSNGAVSEDLTNVLAGTYTVTATDANGCTATASRIVTQPVAPLFASVTGSVNVLCFGQATGSVNITVSGGTSPYIYLWSNGAVTEDLANILAGTYSVTATDANGCTAIASTIISQPIAPLSASVTGSVNVLCFGQATGSVNITVSGGTSPYTYLWSNGAVTEDLANILAGTYSVTATDANGCTAIASTIITQPVAPLSASVTGSVNVLCFGQATGSVNITVSGGTSPYSYLWSNGAVTEDLANILAGTYSVTATDANGCTATASILISQPAAPLSVAITNSVNVLCFGNATGSVNITVSGGTSPYTYLWSNGSISEDLSNIVSGAYTITVTDANGCTATTSALITQPIAPLSASVTGSVNVLCFGQATGSVNITVSGGTSPYNYLWSNGAVTEDLANILAGTYSVTATDANGCTAIASTIISQPIAPLSASVTGSVNVLCFGQATGSVNITVSGGTSPYSYLWSNGAVTEDLTNVLSGTYTVTVTDANGCTATASRIVTQPVAPLSASVTGSVNVLCFGQATGSVNISVSGGTSPYSYLWSNGSITEDLTNVLAGTYTVTATDANGCTATAPAIITQPVAPLTASITGSVNVLCFGNATGSVNITVSGGTSPYSYLWSNGAVTEDLANILAGTYSVTATDANGCTAIASTIISQPVAPLSASITGSVNVLCFGQATGSINITVSGGTLPYSYLWSNGAASEDLTNVIAGNYTVTVTDMNGCSSITSKLISQPTALLSATVTSSVNVLCFGNATGSVDITVSGGTLPYNYLWSNGSVTEDLTNVVAGAYPVVVTDANGCIANAGALITQPVAPLSISITNSVNVGCHGDASGSINIAVSGGTSPYGYLWSNGSVSEDLTNLIAGTYIVTTTDANGCTAVASVVISQPMASLSATISGSTNVDCYGNTTGSINITVSGGTSPYSYLWNNGAISEDLTNIAAGAYSVVATDLNGCTSAVSVVITQPFVPLTATVTSHTDILCCGHSTGSIDLTVFGGTVAYSYLWSNGAITEDVANLAAGTYSVVITDANNCTVSTSVTISQPLAVLTAVVLESVNVSCYGNSTGSVNVTVTGGTAPYSYLWNNGAISEDLSNIPAGTYTVTITDVNLCTSTASAVITQPSSALSLSLTQHSTTCDLNNGSVASTVHGGTPNYTYVWSQNAAGQVGPTILNLDNQPYSVTVTDANGCIVTGSINVGRVIPPQLQITSIINETCTSANGRAVVEVFHGTLPYQFSWDSNPVQHTSALNGVVSGNYSVIVTDANGCSAIALATIQNHAAQIVTVDSVKSAHCNNADGCAYIVTEGGSGSYQYQWNTTPIRTGAIECNLFPGIYIVTVSDGVCDVIKHVNIPNTQGPKADASVNKRSAPISEATFVFSNLSHNYTSCIWNFGDNTSSTQVNPTHTYLTHGTYQVVLMVVDDFGCVDTAHLQIVVTPELIIWIPNTFSPNMDGVNDDFGPVATGFSEEGYEFRIFDRWGQQVFYSNDYYSRWDGKVKGTPINTSFVFSWTLVIADLNGKVYKFKGSVTGLGGNEW